MMKLRVLCSALISALACAVLAGAQTADDINLNTTYQTIRGFGVATAWQPLMSSTVVNSLWGTGAGQMGLTMVRQRIDPSSTTGGSNWSTELQNSLEVLAVAPDATVFATPWTPPAVWKSNDSTIEGTLTTVNYANYANYLNEYIAYMKAGGVNLYAISMQNEPDANVTYESCVWTGATMDAWVAQEGGTINTKLIMPESESFIEGLSDPALADPNAVGKISIIGGHLYGATPYYYTNAKNAGKDVWMTEHYVQAAGSTPAIGDGINVAKEVHNSMAVGQYNAYVWWWANSDIQQGLLNSSNTPSYNGLALAQFSKFIRPGYVMTGANNSPVSGVYVTSYKGSGNYVIVAINSNSGASSIDFDISGATLTSVTPYQTSASNQLAQLSAVSVSDDAFTYSLPAQSITTFVGTGSTVSPSFTLASSPSTLSVTQGSSASDTITVTDVDGFTGAVSFTATGLPSGVTASFGPISSTTSSVLTLTASSTAATGGPVTVTINGVSGSTTASTTVALTVNPLVTSGFTVSPSASSLSVLQGASGTDTITVTDIGGFTGSVAFTASGMPSGVTAAFNPTSSATSSVLTLTASSTATTGAFTITVTGTSGTTATTSFTLDVGASGGSTPVYIDAGGAASGSWAADEDFSGGAALTYTNTVSTSLLTGTVPPQTVLQSQRYGSGASFTYTIPGYTSGSSHAVTLYFVENYVTAAGQREFNVLINGTQVLTNFDVFATAGGQFIAVQKSFTATANSSGDIVIEFSPGAVQNPFVTGIALDQPSSGGTVLDIDAGGAASGSWVADENFSGGTALTYTNAVTTSLLSGTVPPATVLQSQRYGSFTYTIPGYTSGSSHTVTLYFVENYVTGTGQREFNVLINGTQVLTNYDVYAAAGGQFNAVEKSFTTTANSSGQIVIQFSPGAIQSPMVSGIALQ